MTSKQSTLQHGFVLNHDIKSMFDPHSALSQFRLYGKAKGVKVIPIRPNQSKSTLLQRHRTLDCEKKLTASRLDLKKQFEATISSKCGQFEKHY